MKDIKVLQDAKKSIEAEIAEIQSLLSTKNGELRSVKLELAHLTTGFNLGDDVLFDDRKNGEIKAKITAFDVRWNNPQPEVTLYKKDGTLGTRTKDYGLTNLRKA